MKALLLVFLLAGCAMGPQGPGSVKVQEVDVPVVASCIPKDYQNPPNNPATKDALLKAPGSAERYQLLTEFWTLFSPVLDEQSGIIESCKRVK